MMRSFISLVVFILLLDQSIATCTNSPNGTVLRVHSTSLEFCTGDSAGFTLWSPLGGAPLAAICTVAEEGLTKFLAGVFQICKSGSWIDLKTCPLTSFNCLKNGLMVGSKVGPLFCEGTNWTPLDDACPALACEYFTDQDICNTSSFDCHWLGNTCLNAAAICSSIHFAGPCNSTPPCEWSAGLCRTAY